jgi:mRNA interferase MazF
MRRGAVVLCALSGDDGKPRPAVIVQADLFNETHASIVICPITSHLVDAPLFRVALAPTAKNGLKKQSLVMVDKLVAVRRSKLKDGVGQLSSKEMNMVDHALRLWLELLKAPH